MSIEKKNRNPKETSRDGNAAEQRRVRRSNRGISADTADWSGADEGLIRQAIAAVTAEKCAIMFGYTRDGGAYSVRIVGDGESYNDYTRPTEDIDLYLRGLINDFEAVD